jgi:hypothetical protein
MVWPLEVSGQQLFLFCAQKTDQNSQSCMWYEGNSRLSLLPFWQLYSGGMLGHCIQMAAQGRGRMAGDNSLA